MKKRLLGNTGIEVSEIAFGGVEIGMPYGIGVESEKDMLTQSESIYLLHTAIAEGINFFDTARLYGESETIMGKAFVDRRDQVILETKCKHLCDEHNVLLPSVQLQRVIESSLHESLKALQTDYVDVYMLHDSGADILDNEEIANTFSRLKSSGKIRASGISTYTPEETMQVIKSGVWDVIQVPFNLMDQRQKELFPVAARNGIGIVIRSVLLKGLLSYRGKGLHPELRDVEEHIGHYEQLIGGNVTDLPTLATKFALSFAEVSSILVGIDRLEYLYQSIQSANGNELAQELFAKAVDMAYPQPDFLNLHQWRLNGWLK